MRGLVAPAGGCTHAFRSCQRNGVVSHRSTCTGAARQAYRRRMAASISHGVLVAPSMRTPVCFLPTPSICTRNSVLIRRAESFSPSDREPHKESISSMKMIAGVLSRAISNKLRTRLLVHTHTNTHTNTQGEVVPLRQGSEGGQATHRSLSPCHLETRSDEDTEKNVDWASVATALARYDLPVPGGCANRQPGQQRCELTYGDATSCHVRRTTECPSTGAVCP